MVSEQFKDFYEQSGDTGIVKFHAPAIIKKLGETSSELISPLPKYHLIDIILDGADISEKQSYIERQGETCNDCKSSIIISIEKIVLKQDSWKGNHIFHVRGIPAKIFVTDVFCSWITNNKFTNALCVSLEQYAYDELKGWYITPEAI